MAASPSKAPGRIVGLNASRVLTVGWPLPRLTNLHFHLLGHHDAVEEERGGAVLVGCVVEEVKDEVLRLTVVATQQLLEQFGVAEAEGRVHAVAHPQNPQVVHGADLSGAGRREVRARSRAASVATAPLATGTWATASAQAAPAWG